MQARTRTLAWVWLGLGAAGLLIGAWLVWESLAHGHATEVNAQTALPMAILGALLVALGVPLTIGCAALLRGRRYGWSVLMVAASLAGLAWLLATALIRVVINHWGAPLIPLGMLVFCILTVGWLRGDPPDRWARPAGR